MRRKNPQPLVALCIDNTGYEVSLKTRSVYPVLAAPDEHNMVRVIDETGEDYLFPADRFILLKVTRDVEETVSELVEA